MFTLAMLTCRFVSLDPCWRPIRIPYRPPIRRKVVRKLVRPKW